jgi:outer membrane lipoprotein carrier protein
MEDTHMPFIFRCLLHPVMVLLLFYPGQVGGAELSVTEIAKRLQKSYEVTSSFAADFQQTTNLAFNQRQRQGHGTVSIEKGGRMRWEYMEPDRQVLVSDGQRFSMYLARDRQMIVGDAGAYLESDITYAFLSGTGEVTRDFLIDRLDPAATDGYHLKLTPKKSHPQVDYLEIWVNNSTMLIDRLKIVDHFGSITELSFSAMRTNVLFPEGHFSFVPPSGTEVIEQ